MSVWRRVDGLLVQPVGHLWVAYSPSTGETTLLNDESASILELLEAGAADTEEVCSNLAADSGLDAGVLTDIVECAWPRLVEAGLVREQSAHDNVTR